MDLTITVHGSAFLPSPDCVHVFNLSACAVSQWVDNPDNMTSNKLMKKVAASIVGNHPAQELLGWSLRTTRRLMGVGLGKSPGVSGERELVSRTAAVANGPLFRVFDVGANRGEFAELVPDIINLGPFEVHCFEPSGEAFDLLEQRFGADSRFVLNHFGLGRAMGEASLYSSGPASRTASMSRLHRYSSEYAGQGVEQIRIARLDDYCSERDIEAIHLLKIDVEGHEMDVLAGAETMLKSGRVRVASFEFGACHVETGYHFRDFYQFFMDLRMSVYRLTPNGYLHPLSKYSEILEQYGTTNYVASMPDLF